VRNTVAEDEGAVGKLVDLGVVKAARAGGKLEPLLV